jgi:uncharacterized protein YodC (DUF2158 family)
MSEDGVLKVGDTVCLNSGGHLMTVASIEGDSVTCDWSVKGDVKSKSFSVAEMKKSDGTPPSITVRFVNAGDRSESKADDLDRDAVPT